MQKQLELKVSVHSVFAQDMNMQKKGLRHHSDGNKFQELNNESY